MEKRNYTHIQALLPEIKAMLAVGKTQRLNENVTVKTGKPGCFGIFCRSKCVLFEKGI